MFTIIIIAITAITSIVAFSKREIFFRLRFDPNNILLKKEYWRFITYGFVHAGWGHLLINMFVLFSFGQAVESFYAQTLPASELLFLLLYLGGLVASVAASYFKHRDNPYYAAVGASGAVSAVLFSFILFNPLSTLIIFPIPIPIPAVIFGFLYLIYSAYAAKRANDNIGHDAHFWGAIWGLAFSATCNPKLIGHFFSTIFNAIS